MTSHKIALSKNVVATVAASLNIAKYARLCNQPITTEIILSADHSLQKIEVVML